MEHFIGAYFLLAAGLLIAFVAFIVEIALNAWTVSKTQQKRSKPKEKKGRKCVHWRQEQILNEHTV